MRSTMIAVLAGAALIAGCGGASPGQIAHSSTVARSTVATTSSSAKSASPHGTRPRAAATGSPEASPHAQMLAFARCMRANGVSNFPDPGPHGGGGGEIPVGSAHAPAFRTAQSKCTELVPGVGGGPGSGPPATAQTMAKLVGVAACMRHHGVPHFPDPLDKMPAHIDLQDFQNITDYDGGILLLPKTIDMQSPAFQQAQVACGSVAEGLNHSHH